VVPTRLLVGVQSALVAAHPVPLNRARASRKRAVVGDIEGVFEINRNFRN
jgi:hypothetical protein